MMTDAPGNPMIFAISAISGRLEGRHQSVIQKPITCPTTKCVIWSPGWRRMQHKHLCDSCGARIEVGRAICPACGYRAGTMFSEAAAVSGGPSRSSKKQAGQPPPSMQDAVERARDSANYSLILSLLALFPVLGFILAPLSIYIAVRAIRTLKLYQVEDGRGVAAAGIIIGALALLAQASYCMLLINSQQSATSLFGL